SLGVGRVVPRCVARAYHLFVGHTNGISSPNGLGLVQGRRVRTTHLREEYDGLTERLFHPDGPATRGNWGTDPVALSDDSEAVPHTPNCDYFAAEGRLFAHSSSPSLSTIPVRRSLLTGQISAIN